MTTSANTDAYESFSFEALTIERFIAHQIFPRTPDAQIVPPLLNSALIDLPPDARIALQKRITFAIGSKSHGIEMDIKSEDAESFFQRAAGAIDEAPVDFVATSQLFAKMLADAQRSRGLPGGLLAVVRGRVGVRPHRYLAVIKAETQDGFQAREEHGSVTLEYLKQVLLTPEQRLYKVGVLVELVAVEPTPGAYRPSNYRAFLFDHVLTGLETRNAAHYFYDGFLGMAIHNSAKKKTRDFYELTRDFINSAPVSADKKIELVEALRVELRSAKPTLRVRSFATDHFDDSLRESYESYMGTRGFPDTEVPKDNEYVSTKLRRRRKLVFTSGVQITAPPDVLHETVKVLQQSEEETVVRISGRMESQD